ncbi:unnamed protein product [Arctogadus glacialis]
MALIPDMSQQVQTELRTELRTELQRKILRIQVEDSHLQSSNLTSRPVQQLQPLVQGAAQRLRLDSLPQADRAVRLRVCLETLGVEEETLEGVPAHLRLPVAVTRYWWRRASPEPTLLKALLMASLKDASQLNLLLCKPLPEPHFAWLYQGRLVHQRQKQLLNWEPEEMLHDPQFSRLYRGLLGAVTQPDPGANRRASMEHLHLNTQDDQEDEELGGAAGLDQGSDGPWVEVKSRRRKQ